jgi:hypothetical protein
MKLVAHYITLTPINNGAMRVTSEVLESHSSFDVCKEKTHKYMSQGFWIEDSKQNRILIPPAAIIRFTFIED